MLLCFNIYLFYSVSLCTLKRPGKYSLIWNILPSQGPSYPDLHASNPMALAEFSTPPESLDGAKAIVDDENEDEEEDKMEVVTLKQIA